jgi:hypothetical protein
MDTSYGLLWPSTFLVSTLSCTSTFEAKAPYLWKGIDWLCAPETDCSCIRVLRALHPHDGSTSPNYARQATCQRLKSRLCHHGVTSRAISRKHRRRLRSDSDGPARKRVKTHASKALLVGFNIAAKVYKDGYHVLTWGMHLYSACPYCLFWAILCRVLCLYSLRA